MASNAMAEPGLLCPHCGHSISENAVIRRDGFVLDPVGTADWNGVPLSVSRFEAALLYTLAQAGNKLVTRAAMQARLGSTGTANVMTVLIHRLRKEFKRVGTPDVIEIVWGRGFRWRSPD